MATQLDPDLARMLDEMHGQYPSDAASLIYADAASPRSDMRFSMEEAGAAPPQTSGVLSEAEVQRRREAAAAPEFRHETKFYAEPGTADDLSGVVRYERPVQMDVPPSRFEQEADPQWTAIGPETEQLMDQYAASARREPVQLPEVEVQPQDVETRTRYSLGPSGQVVDMAEKLRKQGEATQQGLLSLAARDKQARAGVALEPKRGEEGFRDWAEELRLAREEDARARRRIGIGATLLSILSPRAAQVLLHATEGGRQNAQRLIEERERLMGEQTSRAEQALERYRAEGVRGLQDARAGAILDERAAAGAEQEWLEGTVSPQTAAYVARFTGEDPETYAGMSNREFAPIAALARARGAPPPDDADVVAELDRLYEWGSQRGTVRSVDPSGRVTFDTRRGGRGGGGGRRAAAGGEGDPATPPPVYDFSDDDTLREAIRAYVAGGMLPPGEQESEVTRLYEQLSRLPPAAASDPRSRTREQAFGELVSRREGTAAAQAVRSIPDAEESLDNNTRLFRSAARVLIELQGFQGEDGRVVEALPDDVVKGALAMLETSVDTDFLSGFRLVAREGFNANSESGRLAQQIMTMANSVLRQISGAAVTENEALRFFTQLGGGSYQDARERLSRGVKELGRRFRESRDRAQRALDGYAASRRAQQDRRGDVEAEQ